MSDEPAFAGTGAPDGGRRPTRAAILTPLAQGGIAVLHVVGPQAVELTARLFRPRSGGPPKPDARRLHYGHIVAEGEIVDEVLVRLVPAHHEPSGEPRVEVNCHGGVVAVQRVLACFLRRGAQAAEAEALLAARAGSRLAAEATRALLEAPTPLGAETLLAQLDGALGRALARLPWDPPRKAADALRGLLATERLGRALWQPPRVVLVGPANAGKSTLFNALAREDRVIVSPTPGTTRDAVAAEVAFGGIPLWLTDTAGHRPPGSALEEQAIARSRAAAADADLVLLVLDGSEALPAPLPDLLAQTPERRLLVVNKADIGLAPWTRQARDALVVSASQGDSLDELARRIVEALVGDIPSQPGRPVVFTARQADHLREALAALDAGRPADARDAIRRLVC